MGIVALEILYSQAQSMLTDIQDYVWSGYNHSENVTANTELYGNIKELI